MSASSAATAAPSTATPIRVLLIGTNKVDTLAGELTNGLIAQQSAGRLALTILSRPINDATTPSKRAILDSLKSRGVNVVFGEAKNGAASLVPLLHNIDVVISSLGGRAAADQQIFIAAAKTAGVKWFIPSTFGYDYELGGKGGVLAIIGDQKLADMEAIKAAGMDFTVFNTVCLAQHARTLDFKHATTPDAV